MAVLWGVGQAFIAVVTVVLVLWVLTNILPGRAVQNYELRVQQEQSQSQDKTTALDVTSVPCPS